MLHRTSFLKSLHRTSDRPTTGTRIVTGNQDTCRWARLPRDRDARSTLPDPHLPKLPLPRYSLAAAEHTANTRHSSRIRTSGTPRNYPKIGAYCVYSPARTSPPPPRRTRSGWVPRLHRLLCPVLLLSRPLPPTLRAPVSRPTPGSPPLTDMRDPAPTCPPCGLHNEYRVARGVGR